MIENVALNAFIIYPNGIVAEGVHLQRHTFFCCIQLSDHDGQLFVDIWIFIEIGECVGSKKSDVGHVAPVDCEVFIGSMRFVPLIHFPFAGLNKFANSLDGFHFFKVLLPQKSNAIYFEVDGPHDASRTHFLHVPPILKRLTLKGVGRYGANGIVPISDLYRG